MERQNNQGTNFYLPQEVMFQILIRLPLKSVSRFKCVCKLWCAIANEHNFMVDHMSRCKMVYDYVNAKTGDDTGDDFKWKSVMNVALKVEKSRFLGIRMTNMYRVRNGATNKVLDLHTHHDTIKHINIFHIPRTTSYKLFYVHEKKGMEYNGGCQVLTVGTDLTWRTLDIPDLYDLGCERSRSDYRAIDDVFFVTRLFDDGYRAPEIVYLEMGSEHFVNFRVPQNLFSRWKNVKAVSWGKDLALTNMADAAQEWHIWILKAYKKQQQWVETKRVIDLSSLNKYPNLNSNTSSINITHNWLSSSKTNGHHPYYHIESKTLQPAANSLPQGKCCNWCKWCKGCFLPSVVNLEKLLQRRPRSTLTLLEVEGIQPMEDPNVEEEEEEGTQAMEENPYAEEDIEE